jgi:hypothetical protein
MAKIAATKGGGQQRDEVEPSARAVAGETVSDPTLVEHGRGLLGPRQT